MNYTQVFASDITANYNQTIVLPAGVSALDVFNPTIWHVRIAWLPWPQEDHVPPQTTVYAMRAPGLDYVIGDANKSIFQLLIKTDSTQALNSTKLYIFGYSGDWWATRRYERLPSGRERHKF